MKLCLWASQPPGRVQAVIVVNVIYMIATVYYKWQEGWPACCNRQSSPKLEQPYIRVTCMTLKHSWAL